MDNRDNIVVSGFMLKSDKLYIQQLKEPNTYYKKTKKKKKKKKKSTKNVAVSIKFYGTIIEAFFKHLKYHF